MARNKGRKTIWESQDNKTFLEKSHLRKLILEKVDDPVILETHGGRGELFRRCYPHVKTGLVFETDPQKAEVLVAQRPNWAVYESDCVWALENGVGDHLKVNFIDADPYGQAWHVLQAFFGSERPRADRVMLVVHDGVRNRIGRFGASDIDVFQPVIERIGEIQLHREYLDVCVEMLVEIVSEAGYTVEGFNGFYSKQDRNQTHFFAELVKE